MIARVFLCWLQGWKETNVRELKNLAWPGRVRGRRRRQPGRRLAEEVSVEARRPRQPRVLTRSLVHPAEHSSTLQ